MWQEDPCPAELEPTPLPYEIHAEPTRCPSFTADGFCQNRDPEHGAGDHYRKDWDSWAQEYRWERW